ncbi:ABC transporter permease [Bifidobacterium sp.]|jgi:multidrug/hemolysin transport system permease protein|uniref:ABC transporter permease n=1 Tax=Bifidobacterium sp. TaxID=41200 RepID=UPI0025C65C73|nr:ABC transporter permease [Bifidobacterium sp.]MCH4209726.1 ABC transporter permease [Bifidobacterium sp.]MCI1224504.1 ABC transporter permease [Bifidobacterium sp.]
MIALTKRNLMLFARNRSNMLFSLLGALIAFVLYVVFLKQTLEGNWTDALTTGNATAGTAAARGSAAASTASAPTPITVSDLLDPWLMGGILSITAITTPLTGMGQLVYDRENGLTDDFRLACRSPWRIQASYLVSSAIIGFVMQLIVLAVTGAYFTVVDQVTLPWRNAVTDAKLLALIALAAIFGSALAFALTVSVSTQRANSSLNTIIGTVAGFLSGVYVPLGTVPSGAQQAMKLWPGAYAASLFRRLLLDNTISDAFSQVPASVTQSFRRDMGIGYEIGGSLTTPTQDLVLLAGITAIAVSVVLLVRWGARQMSRTNQRRGRGEHYLQGESRAC